MSNTNRKLSTKARLFAHIKKYDADEIYIQVTTSSFGHGREVMFRRCKGRQDYRGEHNNFCDIAVLVDPVRFTALVTRETGLAITRRQPELV